MDDNAQQALLDEQPELSQEWPTFSDCDSMDGELHGLMEPILPMPRARKAVAKTSKRAVGVFKRPAKQGLGCSKCRWAKKGCGRCRRLLRCR